MGEEIQQQHFSAADYEQFGLKLRQETEALKAMIGEQVTRSERLAANTDADRIGKIGYELECCLVDAQGEPLPINQKLLEYCQNPHFTVELARYNIEINGNPQTVDARLIDNLEQDLSALLQPLQAAAQHFGGQVGLFGVLPSLRAEHFDPEIYMSDLLRYQQISQQLIRMRGEAVHLQLEGEDGLSISRPDVMLEALSTSLQIHLQVPWHRAVDYYHASLWASLILTGVAANSPLVMGQRCWHESRIRIFEQTVDTRNAEERAQNSQARVFLADGWIKHINELFEQNLSYQPILPEVQEAHSNPYHHALLHNGTIWRWVRPIIGDPETQNPHFRLELRVPPAGPTEIDTLANLVFSYLLVEVLRDQNLQQQAFSQLEQDFYAVACCGLQQDLLWIDGKRYRLDRLVLEVLLPLCHSMAQQLGLSAGLLRYLELIEQRCLTVQNGASWQLKMRSAGFSDREMLQHYLQQAASGEAVHRWPL